MLLCPLQILRDLRAGRIHRHRRSSLCLLHGPFPALQSRPWDQKAWPALCCSLQSSDKATGAFLLQSIHFSLTFGVRASLGGVLLSIPGWVSTRSAKQSDHWMVEGIGILKPTSWASPRGPTHRPLPLPRSRRESRYQKWWVPSSSQCLRKRRDETRPSCALLSARRKAGCISEQQRAFVRLLPDLEPVCGQEHHV